MSTYSALLKTYIGSGLIADRPVSPNIPPDMAGLWFSTDSLTTSIFAGGSWQDVGGPPLGSIAFRNAGSGWESADGSVVASPKAGAIAAGVYVSSPGLLRPQDTCLNTDTGQLVTVGNDDDFYVVYYSDDDGATWTKAPSLGGFNSPATLQYLGGWYILGGQSSDSRAQILSCQNPFVTDVQDSGAIGNNPSGVYSICYNPDDGVWVAMCYDGDTQVGFALTTTDPASGWTQQPNIDFFLPRKIDYYPALGKYVTSGTNYNSGDAVIMQADASDPTTWTEVLVNPVAATSVLTCVANWTAGQQMTVNAQNYTFKDDLIGPNDAPYNVLIGIDLATSLDNLAKAVNASGTPGVNYGTGTVANTDVSSTANDATTVSLEAIVPGLAGNGITVATDNGSFPGATLTGGQNDVAASGFAGQAINSTESQYFLIDQQGNYWATTDLNTWSTGAANIPPPISVCQDMRYDADAEQYVIINASDTDTQTKVLVASRSLVTSWTEVTSIPTGALNAININPTGTDILVSGYTNDGSPSAYVVRSIDSGVTWNPLTMPTEYKLPLCETNDNLSECIYTG